LTISTNTTDSELENTWMDKAWTDDCYIIFTSARTDTIYTFKKKYFPTPDNVTNLLRQYFEWMEGKYIISETDMEIVIPSFIYFVKRMEEKNDKEKHDLDWFSNNGLATGLEIIDFKYNVKTAGADMGDAGSRLSQLYKELIQPKKTWAYEVCFYNTYKKMCCLMPDGAPLPDENGGKTYGVIDLG